MHVPHDIRKYTQYKKKSILESEYFVKTQTIGSRERCIDVHNTTEKLLSPTTICNLTRAL